MNAERLATAWYEADQMDRKWVDALPHEREAYLQTATLALPALSKAVDGLRDVTKLQCSNGNWNYDGYMHGMANGLIMALSMMENTEPVFLSAPAVWLRDLPSGPLATCSGADGSEPSSHEALRNALGASRT